MKIKLEGWEIQDLLIKHIEKKLNLTIEGEWGDKGKIKKKGLYHEAYINLDPWKELNKLKDPKAVKEISVESDDFEFELYIEI